MILDSKLSFDKYLTPVLRKLIKAFGLLKIIQRILTITMLLTIKISFIRTHFDYGDII